MNNAQPTAMMISEIAVGLELMSVSQSIKQPIADPFQLPRQAIESR